ncbi:MAG: MotA/TolQ/ExbB proton channel family protein [Salinivirgaceae bacterium]|nr:MotA/TolQ/ExbB proton channel family protein [Salinivirgaceae bacterium]
MKKLLALFAVIGMLVMVSNITFAQETGDMTDGTTMVDPDSAVVDSPAVAEEAAIPVTKEVSDDAIEGLGMHQILKAKFIEGGAGFMGIVVLALILGLAIAIERILFLNFSTTNSKKLLSEVEEALNQGGVEAAKEVCRNTRGPVASIFYQGFDRAEEGIEIVEKSVVAYGGVQTGLLEKNLSWISLFIALAPMLGFMGTVIGMIAAFDAIKVAGDISPGLVAGGISQALITTVTGLVVAMILQVLYNYCVAKIDSIVNDMEDSSITLIDILTKYNHSQK